MAPEEAAAICKQDPGFVWLGMVEPSPEELAARPGHVRPARAGRRGRAELPPAARRSRPTRAASRSSSCAPRATSTSARRSSSARSRSSSAPGSSSPSARASRRTCTSARLRLEHHPKLLEEGPSSVLWAILDKIVDDYAPVVEGLERDIEEVEQTVFAGAHAPDAAHLPAAPRGHRLLPRRAPAARPRRGDHPGRRARDRTRACASTSATSTTTSSSSTRRSSPSATCSRRSCRPTWPSSRPSRTRSSARSPPGRRSSPSRRSSPPSTA